MYLCIAKVLAKKLISKYFTNKISKNTKFIIILNNKYIIMEDKVLRIRKLIAHLGISNGKFADAIGVYRSDFSNYLSGKRTISEKFVDKIVNAYPDVKKSWLMTGDGEMFAVGENANIKDEPTNIGKSNGTPYYDLDAAACGSMAGFGQALTDSNNSGYISLPFLKTREGDMFIQTRGRSMIDAECPERSIPEGAIVLIRNWRERHIEWGEIYCLVTADGYVVKKLMPGDDDSHIKCVSADSINYPPFSVALSDIQGIARVVAVVSTTVL